MLNANSLEAILGTPDETITIGSYQIFYWDKDISESVAAYSLN